MTSLKQIEANRLNALKSTGSDTEKGKLRSRCNAVRHGLTAETVITGLEEREGYEAFEVNVISDYDATTAVERELVLRLEVFFGASAERMPQRLRFLNRQQGNLADRKLIRRQGCHISWSSTALLRSAVLPRISCA